MEPQADTENPWNHAVKSEVLARVFGLDNGSLLRGLRGRLMPASVNVLKNSNVVQTPAGLGNFDNSCYQNSVIQVGVSISFHNGSLT